MASNNQTQFTKDLANGKLLVTHQCDADVDTVWDMWTKPELLDTWWGPKPWRAETKSMDFRKGGRWTYAMVGPNSERHWCVADYSDINAKRSIDWKDAFTDEKQVIDKSLPQSNWNVTFSKDGGGTKVLVTLLGPAENLKRLLDMGFQEGFTIGLGQLDEELASRVALKK